MLLVIKTFTLGFIQCFFFFICLSSIANTTQYVSKTTTLHIINLLAPPVTLFLLAYGPLSTLSIYPLPHLIPHFILGMGFFVGHLSFTYAAFSFIIIIALTPHVLS